MIKDENREYLLNIGLKQYLNNLCMKNLSTYDGRKKATVKLLNEKNNIPIYIDKNLFMYPTKSLREYSMLFINYYAILSFKKIDSNSTLLIFKNLDKLVVDVSIRKINKQHLRIKKIAQNLGNYI